MAEGVEKIAGVIARNAEVERFALSNPADTNLALQLERALVKLYEQTLRYLDYAGRYYGQSTGTRLAKSLLRSSDKVADFLSCVMAEEAEVSRLVAYVNAERQLQQMKTLQTSVRTIEVSVVSAEGARTGEQRLLISRQLAAVYTDDNFENLLSARCSLTASWVFERTEFQRWAHSADSKPKLLWIHAPAGFGKSVLCASIVEHMRKLRSDAVAYFFCVSDSEAKRVPDAILRSWVAQMAHQNDEAMRVVAHEIEENTFRSVTMSFLWESFRKICQAVKESVFVIDGFDECFKSDNSSRLPAEDARSIFLSDLISRVRGLSTRILLVSRDIAEIRGELLNGTKPLEVDIIEYGITLTDTRSDLDAVSKSIMDKKLSRKSEEIRQEIAEEASQKAKGMFLWLQLLSAKIRPSSNVNALRETVSRMPAGLEQAYGRDLSGILMEPDPEIKTRAQDYLRWILFAARPMTVAELIEASLVRTSSDHEYPTTALPDAWDTDGVDEEFVGDHVRQPLGSLIVIRQPWRHAPCKEHLVSLTHHSVREFLLETTDSGSTRFDDLFPTQGQTSDSARHYLAMQCLRYLCYDVFSGKQFADDMSASSCVGRYPFLSYASCHWHSMLLDRSDPSAETTQLLVKLHDPLRLNWRTYSKVWIERGDKESNLANAYLSNKQLETMHEGATEDEYKGDAVNAEKTIPVDKVEGPSEAWPAEKRGNPLYWASSFGILPAVVDLCAHGADVNAVGGSWETALSVAMYNDHHDVVDYLLERGANPYVGANAWVSPMLLAAAMRDGYALKAIMRSGADVNRVWDVSIRASKIGAKRLGYTALKMAVQAKREENVKMLLEAGADVNIPGTRYALHWACDNGDEALTKLLIEHGSKLAAGSAIHTPLMAAIYSRAIGCVKILLEAGADVGERNNDGCTALEAEAQTACEGDQCTTEITRLLLEYGADVNAANRWGNTPLHFVRNGGMAEILIERSADRNRLNYMGEDPLLMAIRLGHLEAARVMIDHGHDPERRDHDGDGNLHWAAASGDATFVGLMLEKGEGVNAVNKKNNTPLHYVRDGKSAEVLLEHGARINAVSDLGWMPIHVAAANGHEDVVALLLQHGADVNTVDGEERTPLMLAVSEGHQSVAKILLDHGADVEKRNMYGVSPLNVAFAMHNRNTALLLLEHTSLALPGGGETNDDDDDDDDDDDGGDAHRAALLWKDFQRALWEGESDGEGEGEGRVVQQIVEEIHALGNRNLRDGALLAASFLASTKLLKKLLDLGADGNVRDPITGKTALHHAATSGSLEICQLLLDRGMDPSIRSKMGFTAIDICVDEGVKNEGVIRMLTVRHLSGEDADDDGQPDDEAVEAWKRMSPLLEGERRVRSVTGKSEFVIMLEASDDPNHQLPLFAGNIRYLAHESSDWPIYGRLCSRNKIVWKQLKKDDAKTFWGDIDLATQSIAGSTGDFPGRPDGDFTLRKRVVPIED